MVSFRSTAKFDQDAAILLVTTETLKTLPFPADVKKNVQAVISAGHFKAESGQSFPIVNNKKMLLLVGLGKKADLSLTQLRIHVRNAILSSHLAKAKTVELVGPDSSEKVITAIIEGVLIGTYRWKKYKTTEKADTQTDKKVTIIAVKKAAYDAVIRVCGGVSLARDLVNDNADTITSTYIESTIKKIIKDRKNVSVEILNQKDLKKYGLNLHLAVNQGSKNEPKLVIVKYNGAGSNKDYTAFIGKGMTFDTGGLNLKPTGSIENMRMDMSGAAAVVGTLKAVLDLKLKKNVIFAVGLAENVTDAKSYKPGDVFKSYSGKTVEIGNTDAEGRLVLADAISYIVRNYKPARIVNICTLTGACVVALGHDYTGLVSNNDKLAAQFLKSAELSDDRAWALPSYPELKDSVKSQIADIRNLGFPKGAGGAITAAEFLRQFTEDTDWVHLDIAGTAFVDGNGRMYYSYGGTGSGVRLVTHYLANN